MDVAEWFRTGRVSTGGGPVDALRNVSVLAVKNLSGSAVATGGVLAIDSPLNFNASYLDRFKAGPFLQSTAAAPATADKGRVAVALEPIANGRVGNVCLSGIVPARVNFTTADGSLLAADVADGQVGYLQETFYGSCQILWRESTDAGTCWAVVRVGTPFTPNPAALLCGDTTAAVADTDSTFTVDNVRSAGMGISPTTTSTDTIIISNWAAWEADDNAACMFSLTDLTAESGSIGHGNFVQGPCKG